MLEELSKNNELWQKMALHICGDIDLAKDLVQDMYLKLHKSTKDINQGYIYFTLKSLFLDEIKSSSLKNRFVLVDDFTNFEAEFDNYDLELDNETQVKIDLIKEELSTSKLARKLIVTYSIEDGLRKFSRESGINKSTVQKHRNEFKKQVWQRKLKD